jgi:hypothetical protein
MILIRSEVGTLEYISVMSNDTNLRLESTGISFRSVIWCAELRTLNVCGRGMCTSSFLTTSFAILYAGALVQLTIGLMGHPTLSILIRPHITLKTEMVQSA